MKDEVIIYPSAFILHPFPHPSYADSRLVPKFRYSGVIGDRFPLQLHRRLRIAAVEFGYATVRAASCCQLQPKKHLDQWW